MRVVNTNVAILPWTAGCRQQTCRNITGGSVVWWYHTPTASGKARQRERERERGWQGGRGERERREGTPAGRKIAERGFDLRTFGL